MDEKIVNSSAEETEESIVNFLDKILPIVSAVVNNSEYISAQNSISYVKTTKKEDRDKALIWIKRSENFNKILDLLLEDDLVTEEQKTKFSKDS